MKALQSGETHNVSKLDKEAHEAGSEPERMLPLKSLSAGGAAVSRSSKQQGSIERAGTSSAQCKAVGAMKTAV